MNMHTDRAVIKDDVIPINKVDNVRRIKTLKILNMLTVITDI